MDGLSMADVLFEAEGLSRTFVRRARPVPALVGVTIRIVAGARIALVGPSGSGKTTLLNIIAGLDGPTSGRLEWPALGSTACLRPLQIGVMFQSRSLVPALTCLENVELAHRLGGRPGDPREAALAALALFGVDHIGEMLPEEVSGGQAQRVALARAIVTGPRLLLADEPTGQLDRSTSETTIERLLKWTQHGRTLVVATHDPAIASRMTETWRLEHGLLTQVDTTAAA
jgi:ABC-type lipoprotein export system ATPase subunit